jgi:hypothetical protein
MEFLNFVLIFTSGWLALKRPKQEKVAFGLLVACAILNAFLFFLGTRTSILPGVNL